MNYKETGQANYINEDKTLLTAIDELQQFRQVLLVYPLLKISMIRMIIASPIAPYRSRDLGPLLGPF
jgi:hypothetical protein